MLLFLGLIMMLPAVKVAAQKAAPKENDEGEITTTLTAHDKDAIFSTTASYTFFVRNGSDARQTGKISYEVTDQFNKKLLGDSIKVNVGARSDYGHDFNIPALKSGFYKINFMINVSDYDDTTRRVFGLRAEEVRSQYGKPADFDAFWDAAKAELAGIPPNFRMIEKPEMAKDGRKVYLIEFKSLDSLTIRGWLTEPDHRKTKSKTFPVLLILPGYQAGTAPLLGRDDDMAFISVDLRGQGMNREAFSMRREDYIVSRLEDKNKYYLKGVIMDCLRYIDFIFTRPELSHDRISVTGGSMGGYLSITTAALDKRVTLCAPQNPFMSDIYNMDRGAVSWPVPYMKQYVKTRPGLTFPQVMDNLQYYDTKNFATLVTCPFLMGIGLLDPYVPPNNSYAVFNNVSSDKKKIIVFKDLGHEVGNKYNLYEERWLRDQFALF